MWGVTRPRNGERALETIRACLSALGIGHASPDVLGPRHSCPAFMSKSRNETSTPLPVRSFSKRDSKRLPHSRKVQFLYTAAVAMADRNPQFSSHLGRRCMADIRQCVQHHGLSNAEVSRLCKRCGCPFLEEKGRAVALSKSTVRRSQRLASKATAGKKGGAAGAVRGGIECVCQACGNTCPVSKYPAVEVAEAVLHKKKVRANT